MIKEIFPLKIYEEQFPGYENIKQDIVDKINPFFNNIENVKHNLLDKSYSTANNIRDIHKKVDISVITDFITLHVNKYWESLGYTSYLQPYILHLWANKVPIGGSLFSHNHNPNIIAGSFYISANPKNGNLLLEHPLDLLLGRMPLENRDEKPVCLDHEIEVCDGKLVLFPGWLRHKTQINTVDEDRIVIGMNFGCAGQNIRFNENC